MTNPNPNFKVVLAPNAQLAIGYVDTHIVEYSVEAEYGDVVVSGDIETLAHHATGWRHNLPPCQWMNNPNPLSRATALVSHLDLDTVGGLMALEGQKPEAPSFWVAAGYIDLNGIHNMCTVREEEQDLLNAYYAFSSTLERVRYTEVTDVTAVYEQHKLFISNLFNLDFPGFRREAIAAGREWAAKMQKATEDRLVEENALVRVFITDGPFCNAAYFSPTLDSVVPSCVVLNTANGSVTVSFADGGACVNARDLVQGLWGPEAGGHPGIAGSPRGQVMTQDDLDTAAQAVRDAFLAKGEAVLY